MTYSDLAVNGGTTVDGDFVTLHCTHCRADVWRWVAVPGADGPRPDEILIRASDHLTAPGHATAKASHGLPEQWTDITGTVLDLIGAYGPDQATAERDADSVRLAAEASGSTRPVAAVLVHGQWGVYA
jgi:hypothetical protein